MTRRWRTGLVAAVLAAASLALPAASAAGSAGLSPAMPGTRAMWVWKSFNPAEVIAWAGVTGVTEIFVYVPTTVMTDGSLARLQDMRARANAAGIKMRALNGEPGWTTNHDQALAWEQAVLATGLFDGLHVDVEPYLTDGWNTDQVATQTAYLGLLSEMKAASPLPLEADVPFWFGQFQVGKKNFADEVLKRVDAVTVMSYRDTATGTNSMMAISQDWLKRGGVAGKRVRLGAETDPIADCVSCSFAEDGSRRMTVVLGQVDTAARKYPAYAGVAVHRYGAWRVLQP